MTDVDLRTEHIRIGRRQPIEDRQARYDQFREWQEKDKLSLAQIAARWSTDTGEELSRERVRTILSNPRPGTFYKGSPIVTLENRRVDLKERIASWRRRKSPVAAIRVARYREELAEVERELKIARKEAKQLSRVAG